MPQNVLYLQTHNLFSRASINALGLLYEKLGRMAGRSYEETVLLLLKGLKNAEFQTRAESLVTLEKVCYL